ncbi:MAG: dipeptidyl peptidase 3 [Prevotellaceae bacterium]|jgi:dipeptidyl-peptidase-3|nr:dipeptidyl peptidase 3 [Prevotellaceae bacterium]
MKIFFLISMTAFSLFSYGQTGKGKAHLATTKDFNYKVEEFADMGILRYQVPDIEQLTTKQKELLYYLTEAALQGRDILYDQNCKYNLPIRRILETIYVNADDKTSENFKALELYLKEIWVSNGIHHHYSGDKFIPNFSQEYFAGEFFKLPDEIQKACLKFDFNVNFAIIDAVIFAPTLYPKKTNQAANEDLILTSAGNYYDGVTQQEAEDFYNNLKDTTDKEPISYGLNSKLVKKDSKIYEDVYKVGGLYSAALEKVVYWLEKAAKVAENSAQRAAIEELVKFNKSGDLKDFDAYAILWVKDVNSLIDFVNGFTESYGDPLGMKASWESVVNFKNLNATKRTEIISQNAQWFEQNSPIDNQYKKEEVKGVTAKVITAAILGGDCYPTTPIGINLPNSNWIRAAHGSKSVTIDNIVEAYDEAAKGNGFSKEFYWSENEIALVEKYGTLTSALHTDMHECLGHASGKLLAGVDADAMKAYGSTIEEARADLFALYFLGDKKMVELGLLSDNEAFKAEYYTYFNNGLLMQLTRIIPGNDIEEAHMRNRQLIARWVLEKSKDDKALEIVERNGEHFVKVNDYQLLQKHIGELLALIQKIKSTGDFKGAQNLVETYGVKVDKSINQEIRDRYAKLNIKPYKGFVNPVYTPVFDKKGNFIDLKIDYTEGYAEQHLRYSREYSNL